MLLTTANDSRGDNDVDYSRRVGIELKVLRVRAGMLARDVAKQAKVHPMSLSKIERGVTHNVGIETLTRIAKVYGLKASDVLSLVEKGE